ncbi:hypothetical protein Trydic_g6729 [Trypoxylus dichotomus]
MRAEEVRTLFEARGEKWEDARRMARVKRKYGRKAKANPIPCGKMDSGLKRRGKYSLQTTSVYTKSISLLPQVSASLSTFSNNQFNSTVQKNYSDYRISQK